MTEAIAKTVTIRIWNETQAKLEAIAKESGCDRFIRLMDVLVNGWNALSLIQRQLAIKHSLNAGSFGTSRQIRHTTRTKLETIRSESGMGLTRLCEAMAEGWGLLTLEQRAKAIASSA